MTVFPPAEYLVLSSRLVPGLDGGFTIATMQRARHMAAAGVDGGRGPWLMTVDPASHASHDAHRAEFVRLGLLEDPARLRNLFDEAGAGSRGQGAADWLVRGAARNPCPQTRISDDHGCHGASDRRTPGDRR